ncbi:hypothetical protein POKO110462_03230 [Pontibacter korlensis]|uniref:Uncharacterized protein n=1 Tax=Pontibacter korlensis TaxID=400092 RepID=A0A0E3ZG20_9BACT|nr:hypothetical protein PKOR_13065 [Pontibacter korlensis]
MVAFLYLDKYAGKNHILLLHLFTIHTKSSETYSLDSLDQKNSVNTKQQSVSLKLLSPMKWFFLV